MDADMVRVKYHWHFRKGQGAAAVASDDYVASGDYAAWRLGSKANNRR